MKYIIFLITFFLFCSTDNYAQSKKDYDEIKADKVYLTIKNINIKFNAINRSTIIKLVGKPIRVKKEKWETNGANWTRTYIYPNGEIVIEDNSLSFIDIKKAGWGFSFKYKNGLSRSFAVGTGINELIKLFPIAWATRKNNTMVIAITGCDCSILFETDGTKIKTVAFHSEES